MWHKLKSLWRGRMAEKTAAMALYQTLAEHARKPFFYTQCGVPDTVDGRFNLLCLLASIVFARLAANAEPSSARFAQRLYDTMFADFDRNLREMGVGDLSVGKKITALTKLFGGRLQAYQQGLGGDDAALAAALERNLYATPPNPEALQALLRHLRHLHATVAAATLLTIQQGALRLTTVPVAA